MQPPQGGNFLSDVDKLMIELDGEARLVRDSEGQSLTVDSVVPGVDPAQKSLAETVPKRLDGPPRKPSR